MAESVVNLVLGKLAEYLVEEARFLRGVADKAESLKDELTWIKAFLKDADSKCNKDERVKQWVHDVKEVAYMIEDAFEMYLVKTCEKKGVVGALSKIPKKLDAKHKLGAEIDKIQAKISRIKNFRTNYDVELKESTDSGDSTQQQPVRPLMNPEIDEDVVGFEDAMKDTIGKLTDGNISSRYFLSIVGQPGLGKTTLANKVYRSGTVQSHFDRCIWLSISAQFELTKVLKTLLDKLKVDSNLQGEKDLDDLTVLLRESLKETKYLIVLDDIWETEERSSHDLLVVIKNALPDMNNGSRVLITTRFADVAKKLHPSYDPYELALLNEQESQKLLLKKACGNRDCPDQLLPLAHQLSHKCAGLPLALTVLGGQLSMTNLDYHSWNNVMKMLDWNNKNTRMCMDAISTSYQVLPSHLKPCFMYLAIYPEDHRFKAKEITRLWIAEGFVTQNRNLSIKLEDTAYGYLKELVQRCMVQVTKKSCIGDINYCQLHDLIREFAIQKADEENFLTVFSETKSSDSSNNSERRVALHYSDKIEIENINSNLRSLIVFESYSIPDLVKFKLLRVLHLDSYFDDHGLTNLRYLHSSRFNDRLPSFTYSKNLQMVFIEDLMYDLPKTFWDLKMLRHVVLPTDCMQQGPPSSAKLENLLTLVHVTAKPEWSSRLPYFPHLRELHIKLPEELDWESFTQQLSELEDLESLGLRVTNNKMVRRSIQITPTFANFKCMKSLSMKCKVAANDFSMMSPNLVKLNLFGADLDEDTLAQLEKLPYLKVLGLRFNSYCGKRLACSHGGFPRLQKLKIYDCPQLEEWNIEDGAMPSINRLYLGYCDMLQMVPNFQHLTNLRELSLWNMPPQFTSKLQGQENYKVKHIPSISIV